MPNYNESTVAGTSWTRCKTVVVRNDHEQTPTVQFTEEAIISVAGMPPIKQELSSINVLFKPDNLIPLLDPDTLEPTGGTITEAELYVALFSRYIFAAKARDQQALEMLAAAQVREEQAQAIVQPPPRTY